MQQMYNTMLFSLLDLFTYLIDETVPFFFRALQKPIELVWGPSGRRL